MKTTESANESSITLATFVKHFALNTEAAITAKHFAHTG
jgi:hypothetical protein